MARKDLTPLADTDDMFADTRMSFGDHIEDLRTHLMRAIVGFVLALVVCILPPVGPWSVKFVTSPVEEQLQVFYERLEKARPRPAAEKLKDIRPVLLTIELHRPTFKKFLEGKRIDADAKVLDDMPEAIEALLRALQVDPQSNEDKANDADWGHFLVKIKPNDLYLLSKAVNEVNVVARPKGLTTLSVQEPFTVYVKIGLMVGFVASSPWVFYQLWSFVAAGLYPHEKRLVNYYLPVSIALFLIGFFVCEFLALPRAIEALLWFNEWLGFEPELRLNEWLSFAIIMPLVFGLSFQTPVVMLFLFKIGVADIDSFRKKRRISYFVMAVIAAVITPSPDAQTMMMVWIPMCFLYEVGIWLCILQPKSLSEEMDDAELDEMVGV